MVAVQPVLWALVGEALWLAGPGARPTPFYRGPIIHPADWPGRTFVRQTYHGTVTAVTVQSITIRYDGGGGLSSYTLKDGTTVETRIQFAPRPPRKFLVSNVLAAGGYRLDGSSHRLTDVRVGDVVAIDYDRIEGVDICTHIRIDKRPGGMIPPQPDDPWVPPPVAPPPRPIQPKP
ncbi:MAG: hypothetical protein K2P78_08700 [Gemmataceae bacterium]|nr:hypothetical protein [Gemmataceae bacterium]